MNIGLEDETVKQLQNFYLVLAALLLIATNCFSENDCAGRAQVSLPKALQTNLLDLPPVERSIAFYQDLIRKNPRDIPSHVALAQAYARQGRETGDAAGYQKAEACLKTALTQWPHSVPARTSLAMTFYSEHRFLEALDLSRRLCEEDPSNHDSLAIWGDVNLALGNYHEAEGSYRKLMNASSGPAILARMAQIAELKGDRNNSIALMGRAVQKAVNHESSASGLAWYLFRLGELNFNHGRLPDASKMYQAALEVFPRYYPALGGMGKIFAGLGKYTEAIAYYQKAVAIIPQPDFLAALGDLYAVTGEQTQAERQYETVEYIAKLAQINRQIYNRQLANFYSDHEIHADRALQLAVSELEIRKDVLGFDAAAWAYLKNGNLRKAKEMMDQAMRFHTQDARMYYHAAMIANAQGRSAEARRLISQAFEINPYFDLLQGKIARQAFAQSSSASQVKGK